MVYSMCKNFFLAILISLVLIISTLSGKPKRTKRFVVGTVRNKLVIKDLELALMWTAEHKIDKTWKEANHYCKKSNYAGYKNWRLPSISELKDILNADRLNPSTELPTMPPKNFWSADVFLKE